MRLAFAIPVLAACGSSSPPPPPPHTLPAPDPAQLAAMSRDDRCAAVAPRAKPCLDEVMIAEASRVDPAFGDGMRRTLAANPAASASALDVIHRTVCAGDAAYPAAVVTCWSRPDCSQFATCVATELGKLKPAH